MYMHLKEVKMKKIEFVKLAKSLRESFDVDFQEVGQKCSKNKTHYCGITNPYAFDANFKRIKTKLKHNVLAKKHVFCIGGGFKRAIALN